ncbi:MAG: hypothetical protein KAY32_01060 [Candidatus Eisenbacteria sp.]|nr:hypothetical protein [Candidatus Eisenbacteria bacterium]
MSGKPNRVNRKVGITAFGLLVVLLVFPAMASGQDRGAASLITLDADSTSVNDILQILAERSNLNIVTSPEVMGRTISIHLRNTPFDEALNLVVRAAGLGYERVGESILVADVARLETQTGLVTRVFDLQYANADEVGRMLEVLTKNAAANAAGDRIVVRASQSVVEQIEEIIALLDRKPIQVQLTARLIEVNTSALQELGIDWERITDWSTVIAEGPFRETARGALPNELGVIKADETLDYYRQVNAFEIALDAMLTDGTARLLADSKVVTINGASAEFFAGETVPVVITSLSSAGVGGAALQTVQLEKIDVGVRLRITPRVSADGFITTLVEPEVSRIIRFVGPDDDLPQTSTRRVRTQVRVQDGEKIYIGGLLSEEERKTVKKVPILGQIPLLGYLFQHRSIDRTRLDLVIEITPCVVGDAGAALPQTPEMHGSRLDPRDSEEDEGSEAQATGGTPAGDDWN